MVGDQLRGRRCSILHGGVDLDLHGVARAAPPPRGRAGAASCRALDLVAVLDLLAEHAVLVAQAVAVGGNLHRGQRVDEAGGQPAEAAVAQAGVRLRLGQLAQVQPLALHDFADQRLDHAGW